MQEQPDIAARPLLGRSVAVVATAAFATAIGIGTMMPMPPPSGPDGGDKVLHFLAFALLVLPMSIHAPRSLLWLAPAALGYGALIEVVQPYVGRSRELADLVADGKGILIGAAAGLVLGWLWRARAGGR